ncbi:MAG: hypothetical protein U0Y68_07785 [Blastocatellia bacterium]
MRNPIGCYLPIVCLSVVGLAQGVQRYVVQGKNDPVKITYLQHGVLKLQSRTAQAMINVKKDLYGCLRLYDGSDPKSRPSATDAITIRVLDEVIKGDKFFLLLQISTGSGCNVQGRCGAGEEIGVYWWQFNSALKQENYQHALIDSCQQDVALEEWDGKRKDDQELKLETRNGKLALKYTKHDYAQNKGEKRYSLTYDRTAPEQGLQVSEAK